MEMNLLIGDESNGLDREEMDQIMGENVMGVAMGVATEKLTLAVLHPIWEPELKFVSLIVAVKTDCMANAINQLLDLGLLYSDAGVSSTITMSFSVNGVFVLRNVKVSIYNEIIAESGVQKRNVDLVNREAQDGMTSLTAGVYEVAYIQSTPTLGVPVELKTTRTTSRIIDWADCE
jgi:hypothetical protein